MTINADDIIKKLESKDPNALKGLSLDDLKELIKHPYFDLDYDPCPLTQKEIEALNELMSHPAMTDEEEAKYRSDWGPMCSFCKHKRKSTKWEIICDAYPNGVPKRILRGYDHTKPFEGDNGIQFEVIPGHQQGFKAWFSFVYHRKL